MKKRMRVVLACVGAALLFAPGPTSAHHSFVTEFDLAKPITVRGTITRMEWVNPHGWIYIDAKGPEGRVENWKFETGSPLLTEWTFTPRTSDQPQATQPSELRQT